MIQTLTGIDSSASALAAERVRMEVISQNVANAQNTRGLDGKPFQRQQVVFQTVFEQANGSRPATSRVEVSSIVKDSRPPRMVYDPTHQDANREGMVAYPNISIHEEMVDYIASSRAYEANLAVVKNARTMALQTLAIGRR